MIKLVLIGVWACLMTVASSYATAYFRSTMAKPGVEQTAELESKKTKEIDIPKIRDGILKGYVVTQFVYTVNVPALKKLSVQPDAFVVDEAFRTIFNDDTIDFDNLQKYDLKKFSSSVIKNVNARLKGDIVTDLAIQEFTFLSSVEVKQHI